jgi:hypothetical protein
LNKIYERLFLRPFFIFEVASRCEHLVAPCVFEVRTVNTKGFSSSSSASEWCTGQRRYETDAGRAKGPHARLAILVARVVTSLAQSPAAALARQRARSRTDSS